MDPSDRPYILIEICHNCKAHQWCTRHNEQTYENISVQVSKAIKDKIPNANISVSKVEGDKIGSFQVFCNEFEIFSKRALGYFPHAEAVTLRIIDFLDGKIQNRPSSPIKRRPETGQFNSPIRKPIKPPIQKQSGQNKPKKSQTPKIIKHEPKIEPKKEVKTPTIRKEYAPKPQKQQPKHKQKEVKPQEKKQSKKEIKSQEKAQEVKPQVKQKQEEKVQVKKENQTPIEPVQQVKAAQNTKNQVKSEEIKGETNEAEKVQRQQEKEEPKEDSKEEVKEESKEQAKEQVNPKPVEQLKKEEQKPQIKQQQASDIQKKAIDQSQQTPKPPSQRQVREKTPSQVDITVQQGGEKQSATVKYQDFQKQVQKCFSKLDINSNASLQPEQVSKLSDWFLKELDMEMNADARTYFDDCFMKMMAKDNDGKLTMEEFKKICWEILAVGDPDEDNPYDDNN